MIISIVSSEKTDGTFIYGRLQLLRGQKRGTPNFFFHLLAYFVIKKIDRISKPETFQYT